MKQPFEYTGTDTQKLRREIVIDLLHDGPKTSVHIARLMGYKDFTDIDHTLTTQFSKMPVWFDEDDGKWHLIDIPKRKPIIKLFNFSGFGLIRGCDWNGIGGIQALWTQGR